MDQQYVWEPDLSRSVWIHESKFPVLGLIRKPLECTLPPTPLCLEKAAVSEEAIPKFPGACFQQHPEPGLQDFAPMQHQLKEFGGQRAGSSGHILLLFGKWAKGSFYLGSVWATIMICSRPGELKATWILDLYTVETTRVKSKNSADLLSSENLLCQDRISRYPHRMEGAKKAPLDVFIKGLISVRGVHHLVLLPPKGSIS